jgi:hypothetical protein
MKIPEKHTQDTTPITQPGPPQLRTSVGNKRGDYRWTQAPDLRQANPLQVSLKASQVMRVKAQCFRAQAALLLQILEERWSGL